MSRMLRMLLVAGFVVLAFALQASAGTSYFAGTIRVTVGDLEPAVVTGTGVATLNGGSGGTHVTTLEIASGDIGGSDVVIVTDPVGIADNGILSVRLTITNGAGTLGKIVAGSSASTLLPLSQSQLGMSGGLLRLCLFFAGCGTNLPLPLASSHTSGTATVGLGVGGQATIGGTGVLRISVDYRPWTILTTTLIDQPDNSALGTVSSQGGTGGTSLFTLVTTKGVVHGPASAASTVALGAPYSNDTGGVIQFVAPTQVTTNITSTSSTKIATPTAMRLFLVPEPGMMLLIVSGVAGLAVLGHRRMKK